MKGKDMAMHISEPALRAPDPRVRRQQAGGPLGPIARMHAVRHAGPASARPDLCSSSLRFDAAPEAARAGEARRASTRRPCSHPAAVNLIGWKGRRLGARRPPPLRINRETP
ncbi:hypothetical protein GCM10011390_33510 [Aureimonas endophytica]|uniref:Uncharacterized protein n=1 Tax=Aureimonas endophytica TaxID=2027858 RepID=A0A917E7G4_9HYPH|nr:hypothetical protein GCM10011390_33510 [Aureimonas endophytica]